MIRGATVRPWEASREEPRLTRLVEFYGLTVPLPGELVLTDAVAKFVTWAVILWLEPPFGGEIPFYFYLFELERFSMTSDIPVITLLMFGKGL